MATSRQADYLRDLGVDLRASTDDLPTSEASEWIEELKEYATRASLPVGKPLTVPILNAVGARDDALVLPPSRSVEGRSNETTASEIRRFGGVGQGEAHLPPAADESWWKIEVGATVVINKDRTVSVAVSGSEHRRRGLEAGAAVLLAAKVRQVLESELLRVATTPRSD